MFERVCSFLSVYHINFHGNVSTLSEYDKWYKSFAASVLKEKLSAMGSSGILADHQLQAQLQEHHLKGSVDFI